jgi:hypothetical protein
LVELLNPRLRLFAQDTVNAIQLIKKKKVCGATGKLNDEPAKDDQARLIVNAKSKTSNPVQRVPGNVEHMSAAEPGSHHLAERTQRDRLLLQVLCSTSNQIQPWTRRIDADEKKLTAHSKIDRKRNRAKLIDLPEIAPCQNALKLFNNVLQDCLIHPRKNPRNLWLNIPRY